MGLKTDQITKNKPLQELLSQLGDKSDVIEVAEVDGDEDGYLDINDVTKRWLPHQFASAENALFRSGLIRSLSSSKQAPVYQLLFQDQANPAPKVEGNLKAIYISVIHDGKPQGILLTPLADFDSDYQNKLFFAFVDERNYFHEKLGGHSHENIYELTTSFVHTLLYIDKLEKNLFTPITIIEDGKVHSIDLTDDDRRQILAHYEQVLEEIIRIVKASSAQNDTPTKDIELFEKALAKVKRLSYRID